MSGSRGKGGIPRPCIECGRRTLRSRCRRCERPVERLRQSRQFYRVAYSSPEYQRARARRMKRAGGRCEAIVDGHRCEYPAQETHHVRPLSEARSLQEALELCREANLRAVCWRHNPRPGPRQAEQARGQ